MNHAIVEMTGEAFVQMVEKKDAKIGELEAENTVLREALEDILDPMTDALSFIKARAKAALKPKSLALPTAELKPNRPPAFRDDGQEGD